MGEGPAESEGAKATWEGGTVASTGDFSAPVDLVPAHCQRSEHGSDFYSYSTEEDVLVLVIGTEYLVRTR